MDPNNYASPMLPPMSSPMSRRREPPARTVHPDVFGGMSPQSAVQPHVDLIRNALAEFLANNLQTY